MRKVCYLPYSKDYSHPGDRRRIRIWSEDYQIPLESQKIENDDLLVLSASANLRYWVEKHKGPVVIDLIDGYLSNEPRFTEDVARNTIRSIYDASSFRSLTFTNELRHAVSKANAIVVSCIEQAEVVRRFNDNVHIILDDHSEMKVDFEAQRIGSQNSGTITLIWEGLGYTLKHLLDVSREIEEFIISRNASLIIVTKPSFRRYASRVGHVEVMNLLRRRFRKTWNRIEFVDWSIGRLIEAAKRADVAVIPICVSDKFATAKPENKLLSFWTLGLPVLCSPIPSYQRVLHSVGQERFLIKNSSWLVSLNNFCDSLSNAPLANEESRRNRNSYLNKFHTREILSRKWDVVLRPFL